MITWKKSGVRVMLAFIIVRVFIPDVYFFHIVLNYCLVSFGS